MMNGRAFSGNFGKEDNLASYTQIFRIIFTRNSAPFDFVVGISGMLVDWLAFWKFNNIRISRNFPRKFPYHFCPFRNFWLNEKFSRYSVEIVEFPKAENSGHSWRKVNWSRIPSENVPKISVSRYTSQDYFLEISENAVSLSLEILWKFKPYFFIE